MKLATIALDGASTAALVDEAGVHPIRQLHTRSAAVDVYSLIREPLTEDEVRQAAALAPVPDGTFGWLPPIPHPPKNVFCAGLNYAEHVAESRSEGAELPADPVWFSKPYTSLTGHDTSVVAVKGSSTLDYEGELGVVLNGPAPGVGESDVLSCVFGYTVFNDLTDRALQRGRGQWLKGKSPDGYAPCGPWIVTADELPDPQRLTVRTWVNDQLRQDSPTSNMIFPVARLIADLAETVTLEAGDVIATGTPPGVGMADGRFLATGDRVRVHIDGIGELVTTIV